MATYPTLPTKYGTDPAPLNSIAIDRAEDGKARARSFYANDKHSISPVHEWLTSAQKSTLEAFFLANRLIEFVYVSPHDGVSRTCIFADRPKYVRRYGDYWDAFVKMEEA